MPSFIKLNLKEFKINLHIFFFFAHVHGSEIENIHVITFIFFNNYCRFTFLNPIINSFSFPSLHLLDPTVSRFDQVTNNLHKNNNIQLLKMYNLGCILKLLRLKKNVPNIFFAFRKCMFLKKG